MNITFNCSATDETGLSNVSLYLSNNQSSAFSLNQTTNISGTSNSTNWTLDLNLGNYLWNCLAYDIAGASDWATNRTITISLADLDSDGVLDSVDNLEGNESNVIKSGINNLNITINRNSTRGTYNGSQEIIFYDSSDPIVNFTHNFSASELDLRKVSITKTSTSLIVNLSGQLQSSYNKTLYISDNSFISLCVKDAEISSISEISSSCTGSNETDLTSCIGGNLSSNGIDCTDLGSQFKIENLKYSGIRGTQATPSGSSGGSSGGGGGGGSSGISIETANKTKVINECSSDLECARGYSCFNNQCVKLFDAEILSVGSLVDKTHFNLEYLIKGMADINGDVIIKFWIEDSDTNIPLGQDAIYLGSFEEKIKTTTINLPSDLEDGAYDLYVQVNFEKYSVESFRKINIKIGEYVSLSPFTQSTREKYYLLAIVLLVILFIYIEKRREFFLIKKSIKKVKKMYYSIKGIPYDENIQKIIRIKGKICLKSLRGEAVYSSSGDKIGEIIEPILEENKIYGWIIFPDKKYAFRKKVIIKQKDVKEIGEVFIVRAGVDRALLEQEVVEEVGILNWATKHITKVFYKSMFSKDTKT